MRTLILTSVLLTLAFGASIMNRVVLNAKGDALCLDGTPGAYYIGEGSGENKNKFILFFEGGGWCGGTTMSNTLESCYSRSNGNLGSSSNYSATIDSTNMGILSADPTHNPAYYDWTRVFLKYCDGSGHQGTRSLPLTYKDKNLYFRGQNVTIGQFEAIDATHKLFTQATQIIVSGASAGGLAAFLWTNYVADHAKGRVISIPDSGIFLDAANTKTQTHVYRTQFINLMNISNAQVNTPVPECHRDYPTQQFRCMFAQNLYKYIKVPLFPAEPLYDSWSAPNILGISCVVNMSLSHCTETQRNNLEQYHTSTLAVLKSITDKKGNGAWAPACSYHCNMAASGWTNQNLFAIPSGSTFTVYESVRRWQQGVQSPEGHIHVDVNPWPSNHGCSGPVSDPMLTTQ